MKQRHLRCHHCDYRLAIPQHCKECNSTDLAPLGSGTERIHEVLAEHFPDTPLFRIDRDTVSSGSRMKHTLQQIHQSDTAILIGTQMLAKGHHFPRLALVIMVDIDAGWFSADLKAAERTAQLITQVSGRAGRGLFSGKVIIQTLQPEHPLMQSLLEKGYGEFAKQQLAERALLQFPPYGYFCMLRCESNQQGQADELLEQLRQHLESGELNCQLLGPVAAPMARRAGFYRSQLLLKANHRSTLHNCASAARYWLDNNKQAKQQRWSLDIDPADLY